VSGGFIFIFFILGCPALHPPVLLRGVETILKRHQQAKVVRERAGWVGLALARGGDCVGCSVFFFFFFFLFSSAGAWH
jgi:hypothetical protein